MVFLASDDARHITGTELTTDGGTTANLYIVETPPTARPASAAQPESGRRGQITAVRIRDGGVAA